ncbi:MAG TPA: hypothetical protein VKZ63_12720 [Kofleriaceae bacterium]|nr:hypothetical protein [Kofleriaceae bacterium]
MTPTERDRDAAPPSPATEEPAASAASPARERPETGRHETARGEPRDRDREREREREEAAAEAAWSELPPAAREVLREGEPPSIPEGVRNRVEAWVPELVKKAFAAGMGAVFTTEEGIRKLTKEMPLPKDVAGYLVNTASSTKDELFRIVAREFREFLQTVNLSEEIAKMLTTLSFEVKTEIRFIPNDQKYGGVEPDVKAKVRLKRSDARPPRRRVFRRRREDGNGGDGPSGPAE